MKIKEWQNKVLWLVLGVATASFLTFVSTSEAQQNRFVKLLMRFGEERVLEDGTKVSISKGDGDLIVVTLLRATSSSSSLSVSSKSRLQTGTYKGAATTNSTTGTIRIIIKTIDEEGNVKADFRASNGLYGTGSLSGKVDARGELRLTGEMVTTLGGVTRWRLTLVALVEDNALINGKYSYEAVGTGTEGQGEFYRAELERDL